MRIVDLDTLLDELSEKECYNLVQDWNTRSIAYSDYGNIICEHIDWLFDNDKGKIIIDGEELCWWGGYSMDFNPPGFYNNEQRSSDYGMYMNACEFFENFRIAHAEVCKSEKARGNSLKPIHLDFIDTAAMINLCWAYTVCLNKVKLRECLEGDRSQILGSLPYVWYNKSFVRTVSNSNVYELWKDYVPSFKEGIGVSKFNPIPKEGCRAFTFRLMGKRDIPSVVTLYITATGVVDSVLVSMENGACYAVDLPTHAYSVVMKIAAKFYKDRDFTHPCVSFILNEYVDIVRAAVLLCFAHYECDTGDKVNYDIGYGTFSDFYSSVRTALYYSLCGSEWCKFTVRFRDSDEEGSEPSSEAILGSCIKYLSTYFGDSFTCSVNNQTRIKEEPCYFVDVEVVAPMCVMEDISDMFYNIHWKEAVHGEIIHDLFDDGDDTHKLLPVACKGPARNITLGVSKMNLV